MPAVRRVRTTSTHQTRLPILRNTAGANIKANRMLRYKAATIIINPPLTPHPLARHNHLQRPPTLRQHTSRITL
jgi:hypothetical protein